MELLVLATFVLVVMGVVIAPVAVITWLVGVVARELRATGPTLVTVLYRPDAPITDPERKTS
jgi:hypothetical protein